MPKISQINSLYIIRIPYWRPPGEVGWWPRTGRWHGNRLFTRATSSTRQIRTRLRPRCATNRSAVALFLSVSPCFCGTFHFCKLKYIFSDLDKTYSLHHTDMKERNLTEPHLTYYVSTQNINLTNLWNHGVFSLGQLYSMFRRSSGKSRRGCDQGRVWKVRPYPNCQDQQEKFCPYKVNIRLLC